MKNDLNEEIDFVILWVDGNDIEWKKEKNKYNIDNQNDNNSEARYRDWENLQYWFRGVEKFAPWVHKVFFITYGHLPKWLNINHPKLEIVKHSDFIPKKYLPTFNSNAIELNLDKIGELSEKFVLFNDDMFLCKKVNKNDFFKNNLPCECFIEDSSTSPSKTDSFAHVIINNMQIVNENFNKRNVTRKNFFKFFNIKYGINLVRNICLIPWKRYSAIKDLHIPVSLLKSTITELWNRENESLDRTCSTKFRNENNINQYLFRYWQLMEGKFYPRSTRVGKMYQISEENNEYLDAIRKQKYKMICINDGKTVSNIEKTKLDIIEAFEYILPEKSEYEN